VNFIAILDFERRKLRFASAILGKIQTQHRALLVRVEPLHFYVIQRG
jgi:hypothetical protein